MATSYIGYLASALVLCTFLTRTMMPLRVIALGSNLAFIAYGALLHLYPVLVLHIVLLPVNAWRLREIFQLVKSVQDTADDGRVFTALVPFAKRVTVPRGEVLIRKGDTSDALYLVLEGRLWVEEAESELGPGSIVGEMGVLSRTHRRTATVDARTDCELGRVSAEDFQRVYFADPSLGLSLIRLIIDRLTREVEAQRLEAAAA
ncbi:MAG TPA: cyclic nucleotide-binding domain-containing protein [Stellaceae bacterium]|nr:cyclic nucleotide-binding domain-containing protein [Stellaceae bacterium]